MSHRNSRLSTLFMLMIAAAMISTTVIPLTLAQENRPKPVPLEADGVLVTFEMGFAPKIESNQLILEGRSFEIKREHPGRPYLVVKVEKGKERELASLITKSSGVQAEPNWVYHLPKVEGEAFQADPNDPLLDDQWGLYKTQVAGEAGLWNVITATKAITVAIIDSGLYPLEEFDKCVITWCDLLTPGSSPNDPAGHGTAVAGVIGCNGGDGEDARGISGVNQRASLMAIRAFTPEGWSTSDILIAAIDWAREHGAPVINASWGSPVDSPALEAAIIRFQDAGGIFVAAAGNEKCRASCPARFNGVVSVGSIGKSNRRSSFSNWSKVDLVAPGEDIVVPMAHENWYFHVNGTSFAAPHVSGIISLIWGLNPDWTADQVVQKLYETAEDWGPEGQDPFYGHGLINGARAANLDGKPYIGEWTVSPTWLPSSGGSVWVNTRAMGVPNLTIGINGATQPVPLSNNRGIVKISLPGNPAGETWNLSLTANSGSLSDAIKLSSVKVFAENEEGRPQKLSSLWSELGHMTDVATGVTAGGEAFLAGVDQTVSSNYGLGDVAVAFQSESWNWAIDYLESGATDASDGPVAVACGDVTGNGQTDLVVFCRNQIVIWEGGFGENGSLFTTNPGYQVNIPETVKDGTLADFNRDGLDDLVWITDEKVYRAQSLSGGNFAAPESTLIASGNLVEIEIAHTTGKPHFVVKSNGTTPGVYIVRGESYGEIVHLNSFAGNDVAVGYLNGGADKMYDIIVPAGDTCQAHYFTQESGFAVQMVSDSSGYEWASAFLYANPYWHKTGDPLLLMGTTSRSLNVVPFSSGQPGDTWTIDSSDSPRRFASVDLDSDGAEEIVAGSSSTEYADFYFWRLAPCSPPNLPYKTYLPLIMR